MSNAAKEPVISGTGWAKPWAKPEMVIPASQINKTAKELQEELNKGGIIELHSAGIDGAKAGEGIKEVLGRLQQYDHEYDCKTGKYKVTPISVYKDINLYIGDFVKDGLVSATNANIILSHLDDVNEPISTKKMESFIHDNLLTREDADKILDRLLICG